MLLIPSISNNNTLYYKCQVLEGQKGEVLMKAITLRIKRIRAGLTQAELAKRVGLTQPLISQLEAGFYIPGSELMQKINDALKQQQREGNQDGN